MPIWSYGSYLTPYTRMPPLNSAQTTLAAIAEADPAANDHTINLHASSTNTDNASYYYGFSMNAESLLPDAFSYPLS